MSSRSSFHAPEQSWMPLTLPHGAARDWRISRRLVMSGWSSHYQRLKPRGPKSFTCDSWHVTCCLGQGRHQNQATGDRRQAAAFGLMLRLLVRATRRVAGEQLMADGYVSDDAADQAHSHAPSPALRSEMSWSTPDRIM